MTPRPQTSGTLAGVRVVGLTRPLSGPIAAMVPGESPDEVLRAAGYCDEKIAVVPRAAGW